MKAIKEQYDISKDNIMAKDAMGKIFGIPKRLSNDIIINIKIKCNQAQEGLQKLFEELIKYITDFTKINNMEDLNKALEQNELPLKIRKKLQRIRSAFSASEEKHRLLIYNKINNFQISKKKLNFKSKRSKNKKISKNNLIFYNNSYWLKKLIKLRKLTNLHHYEKHFGSTESCPLCQKMEKKNEESIREKGIQSLFSEKKNESINLNSRRIKSAISRYNNIKRSKNESINLQKNKSRNLITNKSGFNSSIINEKKNKNNITLKTNIV